MKIKQPAILPYLLRHDPRIHIPALVIVGPVEEECGQGSFFDQFPWQVCRMRECLEFATVTPWIATRVIVCERDLPDGDWKDILEAASRMDDPPPLIVTSRLADDRLWAEVLNLGGYDVLAKPLDRSEVHRVVTLAWERAAEQHSRARQTHRKGAQEEVRLGAVRTAAGE